MKYIGYFSLVSVLVSAPFVQGAFEEDSYCIKENERDFPESRNVASRSRSSYWGYGSETIGGRYGEVLWIDASLGDPTVDPHACTRCDPCSFRKAILQPKPRTVKVTRGGTITLNSRLNIQDEHSFLTFDGSSSPPPGVTLQGNHKFAIIGHGAPLENEVQHIIISHLRYIGTGENAGFEVDGDEGFVHNVVLDHISYAMADKSIQDPKFLFWARGQDFTFSHNLIYDSLKGLQVSGKQGQKSELDEILGLSIHNNVFYNVSHRQPVLRSHVTEVDIINNLFLSYQFQPEFDTVTRIRNKPAEHQVQSVNIEKNIYYSEHMAQGEKMRAIIFGETHGPDDDDGGPAPCAEQGELVTASKMGAIWVDGNIIPNETCDKYSTTAEKLLRPAYAQLLPVSSMAKLCFALPQQAGMKYKNQREKEIIREAHRNCWQLRHEF